MGTSGSSTGSPSGTPLIPPWVSDPDIVDNPETTPTDSSGDTDDVDQNQNPQVFPSEVAPAARFRGTRINFGSYAKSGDQKNLRRGLGHYVRTGYGGKESAIGRFKGTAHTAGAIFSTLSTLATQPDSFDGTALDTSILKDKTARQIVGTIISIIKPADGTQDTESSRNAANNAFSELLDKYPDADLFDLTIDQRLDVTDFFIGNDIFNRVWLDVGKSVQDNAPTAGIALQRLKDMKQYIKSEVARVFRDEKSTNTRWTAEAVQRLANDVIAKTISIFEDYL